MTFNPVHKARLVGVVILFVLVFAYLELRPAIMTLTATEVRGDVALWLYANDLTPGDRFRARVWTDDGVSRAEIEGVRVQTTGQSKPRYTPGDRSNDLDFEIEVPPGVSREIEVVIEVASSGSHSYQTFHHTLDVYSSTTSWLRRGVKLLIAFASWIVLMLADTARRRWYVRRHRRPSRVWLVALVPVAAVGWFWFAELIEHVTRLYGWLLATPALAVWLLAFRVSGRRSRYAGMKAYSVEQVMMEIPAGAAFRGARSDVPMQPIAELELAWIGAGFEVDRVGNSLRLLLSKRGTAMISVPPSGILGGGEAFGLHASDDDIATLALHAVTPLLGELRAHAGSTQLTVSSTEVAYR